MLEMQKLLSDAEYLREVVKLQNKYGKLDPPASYLFSGVRVRAWRKTSRSGPNVLYGL